MAEHTFLIQPAPPFDFGLTADNQPYFRQGDQGNPAQYRRLLDLGDDLVLATVSVEGSPTPPRLAVKLEGDTLDAAAIHAAQGQLELLLATRQELGSFYAFAQQDPVMALLVKTFYGMHLSRGLSVYETIAQAILGQQLAAGVARVIRGLLVETYGPSRQFGGQHYFAFPRPDTLAGASIADLRRSKLSQRKAEYLQGIARAQLETPGGLDRLLDLPDAEAVKAATSLRGVGPWTAQWVLSRALGRPDAFPSGDLALQRIVSRLYFDDKPITPPQLEEFSSRWSPYRSFATAYLFAALRTGMPPSA